MQLTYRQRQTTTDIILHDTHTVPGKLDLVAWLKVEGRRMGLLGIGYHFLILEDGRHIMTRPHDTIGSHTSGYNRRSIGIALAGGRRETPGPDGEVILRVANTFTPAQMEALRWITQEYLPGIYGHLPLKGHSELGHHRHSHDGPCPALNMETLCEWLAP